MIKYILTHLSGSIPDGNFEEWKCWKVGKRALNPTLDVAIEQHSQEVKTTRDPPKNNTRQRIQHIRGKQRHLTTEGVHNEQNKTRYVVSFFLAGVLFQQEEQVPLQDSCHQATEVVHSLKPRHPQFTGLVGR